MKRAILTCFGLVAVSCAMAHAVGQGSSKAPYKIQIRHADPWMIKAMIEGMPIRTPEMSTLPGFAGIAAGGAASAASSLLKDGFLVVNPTDNSLWYFPSKN